MQTCTSFLNSAMEFANPFDDISSVVEETDTERVCRNRRHNYEEEEEDQDDVDNEHDGKYKSKNLKAERKRREKLKSRMLELRSVVPKITNAMILNDYIILFVCLDIIV